MSARTEVYTVIKKVQTTLNADQVTELPLKRRCFPIMLRGCFVVYLFIYFSIVLVISAYCMRLDESVVIFCGRRRFTLVLQPLTVVQPPISHLSHRRSNSLGTRSRIQTAAAWVFVQSDWLDNVSSQGSSACHSCRLQLNRGRLVQFQSPSENTWTIMITIIIIIVTWSARNSSRRQRRAEFPGSGRRRKERRRK